MIYKMPLLEKPLVDNILNFYDFCEFRDGKSTGSPDKAWKYNEELYDPIHTPTLVKFVSDKVTKCEYILQKFLAYKFTDPVFLRYNKDMHYRVHNDFYVQNNDTRTDYSMTIFLNDPEEYEGGELVISVGTEEIRCKEPAGHAVIYQTGLQHRVEPIISGSRKVCIMWFESLINNPQIREAVGDLWSILKQSMDNPEEYPLRKEQILQIESVRFNLIRSYGNVSIKRQNN